MARLYAQAERTSARPGGKNVAQRRRDLLGVLDEVRRPAVPAPRLRDLDGAAAGRR